MQKEQPPLPSPRKGIHRTTLSTLVDDFLRDSALTIDCINELLSVDMTRKENEQENVYQRLRDDPKVAV